MVTDFWSLLPNISSKRIQWVLDKALPDIVLSESSLSLNTSALTGTFTITRQGDGVISVSSSNTSIATVSLSSNTATVTAKANGLCTITVNVASSADGNYSSNSKTLSVSVTLYSTTFGNNTPAQIQSAVANGSASTLWSAGDTIDITLVSGTVGSVTLNGTYKFAILGIDHNNKRELPSGKSHSIHLGLSKNASGTDIAFTDWTSATASGDYISSNYYFVHDDSSGTCGSNAGGWASSNMRTNICSSFLNCLPSAWQNVITAIPKYTDNKGGTSGSNGSASDVTATTDKIWLLAEFETFGARRSANIAEQNLQEQYNYYKNGNSVRRYGHQQPSTEVWWWERSVAASSTSSFCDVVGWSNTCVANVRCGFVPCFAICG